MGLISPFKGLIERFLAIPLFLEGPKIFSPGPEPAFGGSACVGVRALKAAATENFPP
jgi:hypothetical protein